MTSTTTPQWTITARDADKKFLRIVTLLGGNAFYVYETQKGWFFVCDALRMCEHLKEASNSEQAIANAVVAVSQHLAQLSDELSTIPLTINQ